MGTICSIYLWNNLLAPYAVIKLSPDSGKSWSVIEDINWVYNNSYNWIIQQINSGNCLIRIENYPCTYDQSEDYFTIIYPVSSGNENELPTKFS